VETAASILGVLTRETLAELGVYRLHGVGEMGGGLRALVGHGGLVSCDIIQT
jgi:hypothetical protein